MKYLAVCAAFVIAMVFIIAGTSCAGEVAARADEGRVFSNTTTHPGVKAEDESAGQKKSLTEMLRDYKPEDTAEEPDEEDKLFDADTDRAIRYDEKDFYRHSSGAGYQKQKEDFIDPKKVMTK